MRRQEEGAGHRHERVQALVLEELSLLMRDDVADPTLANVRLTAVVLSSDYRHARVHFALTSGVEQRRDVERALVRVTPLLRARLADAIEMKRVPDLRFVFDAIAPSGDSSEGGGPSHA